jgi:hypothetical protein
MGSVRLLDACFRSHLQEAQKRLDTPAFVLILLKPEVVGFRFLPCLFFRAAIAPGLVTVIL